LGYAFDSEVYYENSAIRSFNCGNTRADMGGDCKEHFDKQKFSLYRNVLTFNKQHRKHYYALLSGTENVNVIVFKGSKQANAFLDNCKPGASL